MRWDAEYSVVHGSCVMWWHQNTSQHQSNVRLIKALISLRTVPTICACTSFAEPAKQRVTQHELVFQVKAVSAKQVGEIHTPRNINNKMECVAAISIYLRTVSILADNIQFYFVIEIICGEFPLNKFRKVLCKRRNIQSWVQYVRKIHTRRWRSHSDCWLMILTRGHLRYGYVNAGSGTGIDGLRHTSYWQTAQSLEAMYVVGKKTYQNIRRQRFFVIT